jgi:hypothetical protein
MNKGKRHIKRFFSDFKVMNLHILTLEEYVALLSDMANLELTRPNSGFEFFDIEVPSDYEANDETQVPTARREALGNPDAANQ